MFKRTAGFREFLSLSAPLMVHDHTGEPAVLLAFAIRSNGELVGMVVGPTGGSVTFHGVETLDFPSPIRLEQVATGRATLGDRPRTVQ
jgi:hypothetical protein